MRGIILAFLLAVAGSERSDIEPVFSQSKTIVYDYEAVILNGLPENGLVRSGIKVNCKFEIKSFAQRMYLLKIQSPEIKEYNGVWPKDPFTRSSKLTKIIADQLTKPVKFEYHNGRVGNIYASDDVSDTVVNIYRGILNLFQMTMKKTQNVYELQESSIGGVCHTRYVVQEDRRGDQIIVHKSTDLNNCQDKVSKNVGIAFLESCIACKHLGKNLRGTAAYTYKLKKREQGAFIMEVSARQIYHYSPFAELNGAAVMEARQVITWAGTKGGQTYAPQIQLQNRGGLHYQVASEVYQIPIHLMRTKSPEGQIEETLQHLVQNNQQQVHNDAPPKFLELTQLLRLSSTEGLQGIWKQYSARPQYRRWLLNAIPVAGTMDSLKFIKQSLHNQDLSPHEAAVTITLAMQFARSNQRAFQVSAELVKDPKIQKYRQLYKAAILAYGSMVNKYCEHLSGCPEAALEPLHDLVAEAHSKVHEEDISLALKALGNAGQPQSIKWIQKFLPGFSSTASQLPVRIQTDAVMALRNIAQQDQRKVQEILLQVFMNRNARTEVRQMASLALFETKPGLALVTTIANVVVKESKLNLQLASFIYNQIKALSRSRVPHLEPLAAARSVALKIMNPAIDKLGFRYSKVYRVDHFKDSLMAGAAAKVYIMKSANTMSPMFILAKIRGYVVGEETDDIEIGIRGEGLEEMLRKQNVPFSEYPMRKKMMQTVKTLLRRKALPSQDLLLSGYIKINGQELSFSKVNKEVIQTIIQALNEPAERQTVVKNVMNKLLGGFAGQWAHALLATEVRHIVPTSVGFPAEFSLYTCGVVHAAISNDVKVTPTPSSGFNVSQLLESQVQLRTDLNPSVLVHAVATMGVNTHLIQSGLEFHARLRTNLPAKLSASFDMKENIFKIETSPSQQEDDLVVVRVQTFAMTRNVEELDTAKKTPILPRGAEPDIQKKHFETGKASAEGASMMDVSSEIVSKKYAYSAEVVQHQS